MHLYIELNTGLTENVSSSVIKKLYELASGGTLDATSDIKGTLHTTIVAANHKSYLEGMFSDLHITADEYSIAFEDPEIENICVTNWGSNGAVTLAQLLAVTSVGAKFRGNTNIVKFNEFLNFTGLSVQYSNYNQQTFSGCTNLKEIVLPSNTTCIGSQMFLNCSSLESLTIPNSVKEVGNLAFEGCTRLVTMIPLPVGCTSVPNACYCDCNSMAGEFIIPATVTSIGEYAFRRTDSFTGIKIYATTPPTINVMLFGSLFSNASSNNDPAVGYPIYVPQSALATYQADTNWSKFGSRLQGFTP